MDSLNIGMIGAILGNACVWTRRWLCRVSLTATPHNWASVGILLCLYVVSLRVSPGWWHGYLRGARVHVWEKEKARQKLFRVYSWKSCSIHQNLKKLIMHSNVGKYYISIILGVIFSSTRIILELFPIQRTVWFP